MTPRAIASKLQNFLLSQFHQRGLFSFFDYGVALLAVAAAAVTTLLLGSLMKDTPSALFYLAVMVSSWTGGLGSGLLATVLSTIALNYFFLEPHYSLNILEPRSLFQLGIFAVAALLISYLNESRLRAMRRADTLLKSWRDSEAQFTHLVEANIIGIFVADRNGSITEANDAFLQMIGYSREDLLSRHIRSDVMTPPEYQQMSEQSQQELRTLGVCNPFEQEYIRKDGSRVLILLGAVMQGEHNIIGFVLDRSESKRNETERQQTEDALRESEERLRLALTAANQGLYDLNLQTGDAIVTPEYARMLGYEPDEFQETNAKWRDRLHPDDVAVIYQIYEDYVAGRRDDYRIEFRQRTKSGDWKWILSIGKIVAWDSQGQPLRMLGTHTDISDTKQREAERQQVEEALREREQRLALATSAAKLGVFEWNIQADQAVWENSRMYEIFGRTRAEGTLSKAEFINSTIHPDDREAFELALTQSLEQGSLFQISCRICRSHDREWRWVEFNGQFELAPDGAPLCLVGVLSDISTAKHREAEREQLLHRLETSLGQLEAVINSMAEGLVIADPQGNILTFNPAALHIHGYDSLEQVQQHLHEFPKTVEVHDLQGNCLPLEKWPIARALHGETFSNCEIHVHRHDLGKTFIGSYSGTPVRDKQGQVVLAVATMRDITQQRQAQTELARSLAAEQTAREEAERANRIKDEFLAVLSHELRSPLNPILGWTQLLQTRSFTPEKTVQALATIERNAKLQAQLIEDLLDVSRILQGKMVLNTGSVDLVTTIEGAIETVRLAAEAKGIQINTFLNTGRGMTVAGDSSRLQQVIWNLLTNAVKFTARGGQVAVRLDRIDSTAQIQVQDTGKGISAEFLPYVFDYFRQEDGSTTRKFGGLGLGLAIVRHLTEQHGGTVSVESAGEGQGATFTIRLPLQAFSGMVETRSLPTQPHNLNQLKILVVDDEADMRTLALVILESQGATVKTASCARQALALLEQWQPDILVSDIGMPEIDGYMLMRQVRSLPLDRGGQTPAIALTAYAGEIDQQQAIAVGFQRHLAKPVAPDRLVEAISTLCHCEGKATLI